MAAGATILIPGITGTTLVDTYGPGFDTIWSAVQRRFETIQDLALDGEGAHELEPDSLVLPGPVEGAAYGECVRHLRQRLGHPVYLFRYDWRQDNRKNAQRLKDFVVHVKAKLHTRKLNFVTHSMGALVLLGWLGMEERHVNAVERAVLTAPPLLGSPEAVVQVTLGEQTLGLNLPTSFRKIARTFPAIYQLVGFYDGAFQDEGSGQGWTSAKIWDETNWQHRVHFLSPEQRRRAVRKRDMLRLQLARAKRFHSNDVADLDGLSSEERRRFLLLYGTGAPTPETVRVRATNTGGEVKNFFLFSDHSSAPAQGDGVVPGKSARRFSQIQAVAIPRDVHYSWWPGTWDDRAVLGVAGYHGGFLALDKNISMVRSFLQGHAVDPGYVAGLRA